MNGMQCNPNPDAMLCLAPSLDSLLKSLPPRPVDERILSDLVQRTLDESKTKSSPENKKSQWEYLLKNEIFVLAVRALS
jgi:hypothetical protein